MAVLNFAVAVAVDVVGVVLMDVVVLTQQRFLQNCLRPAGPSVLPPAPALYELRRLPPCACPRSRRLGRIAE